MVLGQAVQSPPRPRAASTTVNAVPARPDPAMPAKEAVLEGIDPRRRLAFAVVVSASFVVLLDGSIVNLAIPSIQAGLRASNAVLQLAVVGFQLGYGAILLIGARLGDIAGRRAMFSLGMAGFAASSLLCGLAPSAEALLVARVAQGLAAGLMYPQVLSVIQFLFAPRERARAFSMVSAVASFAFMTGPLLGGLILAADFLRLGWRPIFLLNVPVGLAAIVGARLFLRESRAPDAGGVDVLGMLLAFLGILLLVTPLVVGREAGWPSWSFVALGCSVVVAAGFVGFERRRAARGAATLVELRLFGSAQLRLGLALTVLFLGARVSFYLMTSVFLQSGAGVSAPEAGFILFPAALGGGVTAILSGRLLLAIGRRVLVLGLGVMMLALLLWLLTLRVAPGAVGFPTVAPFTALFGAGVGLVLAPLASIVMSSRDPAMLGSASGLFVTAQQIGGALGIAVAGIVFFGTAEAGDYPGAMAAVLALDLVVLGLGAGIAAAIARFAVDTTREV